MIPLPAPITLTVKSREAGKPPLQIVLRLIDLTIVDISQRRIVQAFAHPLARPLTLWEGDAYTAAGDYTQAQAEARFLEALNADLYVGVKSLFQETSAVETPA